MMNSNRKPEVPLLGVSLEASLVPSDASAVPSKAATDSRKIVRENSANTTEAQVALGSMSHEELLKECQKLQGENLNLKQQLQKKEEQRLTAIRLLKQAKKRQEQHKLEDGPISLQSKGKVPLDPYFENVASVAPSITCSIMSIGKRSIAPGYRRTTGLKELINPDAELIGVLEKLSSAPVLGVLKRLVDQVQNVADGKV